MKIIIPVFGFGKSGGYRVLSRFADRLVEAGYEVSFISSVFSSEPNFPTRAGLIWIDNKGRAVSSPNNQSYPFFRHMFALRKAIARMHQPKDYDLIFLNYSLTAVLLPSSLISCSIYYSQAYEPDYFFNMGGLKNYLLGKLSERSYSRGLFTIVNSPVFMNFKKLKSNRVLLPGVDFSIFYPKEKKSPANDKIIIGTIGRIEPYKGSKYIYEAFKMLTSMYPQMELHVAYGSPDLEKSIPGIHCIYPKNDVELGVYYRSLDFYICAVNIHFGAFHYPIVEAMACGVPVISTPFYPVTDTNAFPVEKISAQGIVDKLLQALENEDIVAKKVKQAFSDVSMLTWESAGDRLLQFIEEKRALEKI